MVRKNHEEKNLFLRLILFNFFWFFLLLSRRFFFCFLINKNNMLWRKKRERLYKNIQHQINLNVNYLLVLLQNSSLSRVVRFLCVMNLYLPLDLFRQFFFLLCLIKFMLHLIVTKKIYFFVVVLNFSFLLFSYSIF